MLPVNRVTMRFFYLSLLLLLLYGLLALLGGLKFLTDSDALLTVLPYQQASAFASISLTLSILTGLLGGGIYVVTRRQVAQIGILPVISRLWQILVIVCVIAAAFGLVEGRQGLELTPALDGLLLVGTLLILLALGRDTWRSALTIIWGVGLCIWMIGAGVSLIPAADYLQDRALRALSIGLHTYLSYPLMALALGYWLMHRFSNLTPLWLNQDSQIAAALLTLAGTLLTLASLAALPDWVSGIAALAIPVLLLMVAARTYRALTERNPTYTLAAHWFAMSVIVLLLGMGIVGGLQTVTAVRDYTLGTRLTDLQRTLCLLAVSAMVLGVMNQAWAEIRGENRRVTGLVPFWLIGVGVLGGGAALGAAGVVQTYMERILSVGYLDTQALLVPLYTAWVAGQAALLIGVLIYALAFWWRRPS